MNSINKQAVTSVEMLEKLKTFLKHQHLPFNDLMMDNSSYLLYVDQSNAIIACGGLEYYENTALLRSLAVAPHHRGQRTGKQMVDELLSIAKERSINEIYLLTETARDFFLKLGFNIVARDQVPETIKQSTEFSHVCPASAVCMHYKVPTP